MSAGQPLLSTVCTNATFFIHTMVYKLLQPFNGLFSRTTWVSRYQKGKTNLDFTGARDNEWQWHQLGHMQVCTSLRTDNHASTPPFCFLQAGCPSCRPTNSVKALKANNGVQSWWKYTESSYINWLLLSLGLHTTNSADGHYAWQKHVKLHTQDIQDIDNRCFCIVQVVHTAQLYHCMHIGLSVHTSVQYQCSARWQLIQKRDVADFWWIHWPTMPRQL